MGLDAETGGNSYGRAYIERFSVGRQREEVSMTAHSSEGEEGGSPYKK